MPYSLAPFVDPSSVTTSCLKAPRRKKTARAQGPFGRLQGRRDERRAVYHGREAVRQCRKRRRQRFLYGNGNGQSYLSTVRKRLARRYGMTTPGGGRPQRPLSPLLTDFPENIEPTTEPRSRHPRVHCLSLQYAVRKPSSAPPTPTQRCRGNEHPPRMKE